MAALVAVTLQQYVRARWTTLTLVGLAVVPLAGLTCGVLSRQERCLAAAAAGPTAPGEPAAPADDQTPTQGDAQ